MKKDLGIYFWSAFILLQITCTLLADFEMKYFKFFYVSFWVLVLVYSVYKHITEVKAKKVNYFVHNEIVDGFGSRVKFLCKNVDDTYMIKVTDIKGNKNIYHFELDVLIQMGFIPTSLNKA